MRAEIEQRDKALEIMKNKELEHIAKLAKAEQEIKSLATDVKKQPVEVKINKVTKDESIRPHSVLHSVSVLECTAWCTAFQMRNTTLAKRPRISASEKRKQQATPCLSQNKDFRSRSSKYQDRPWIIEKGLDVSSLVDTHVPGMVATRHWARYVERPLRPNKRVVAEFYASMIPERFLTGGAVLVQGVAVHITPEAISQYFAAPKVRVNTDHGIEWIEEVDQYRGRLAAVLRMDGREEWNQMVKLLLHRLVSSRPIDLGRFIFRDICQSGFDDTLFMVFPCLITVFCRNVGIDVDTGLEEQVPTVMGLTHWNNLLHSRGLPTIGPYRERRRRQEEREALEAQAAHDAEMEEHL
ncbi:hypothetical protein Dsin_009589 [Dipteronia sinensis]|uniref:Uncharacterized protein n=1 Tax=Dipteronia sinensis TaxID=43782 RepID=A0AAE0EC27_9ROSI|nr:hypothetical protein Dsin_009589 [Dipteronia sinensis]